MDLIILVALIAFLVGLRRWKRETLDKTTKVAKFYYFTLGFTLLWLILMFQLAYARRTPDILFRF